MTTKTAISTIIALLAAALMKTAEPPRARGSTAEFDRVLEGVGTSP